MALSGSATNEVNLTDSQAVGLVTVNYNPILSHRVAFTDGAGARKARRAGSKLVTLAGGGADLDLAGGLVDLNGNAITFVNVKALMLLAPAANAGDVTVGAHATAPWASLLGAAGTLVLRPGTSVGLATEHAAGYAVTPGTGDVLHFAGTDGDTVQVAVGGEV